MNPRKRPASLTTLNLLPQLDEIVPSARGNHAWRQWVPHSAHAWASVVRLELPQEARAAPLPHVQLAEPVARDEEIAPGAEAHLAGVARVVVAIKGLLFQELDLVVGGRAGKGGMVSALDNEAKFPFLQ